MNEADVETFATREATYGMTEIADHLNAPDQGRYKDDKLMMVRFYYEPKDDPVASAEAGRPMRKDVEYVSIRAPGNKENEIKRPARDSDKQRWPEHYAAFKNRMEMPLEGFPLKDWPAVTRAMVETMSFMGIKTVEQLAHASDANIQGHMGVAHLKEKAKAWLAATGDQQQAEKIEAELRLRDNEIANLKNELQLLKDAIQSQSTPDRKVETATAETQ